LRRTSDDAEFVIPSSPQVVALADLSMQEPRMTTRGAANDAFQALFSLPFGQRVVDGFRLGTGAPDETRTEIAKREEPPPGPKLRTYAGITLLSAGAIGAAASVYSLQSAGKLRDSADSGRVDGATVANLNEKARERSLAGAIGLGVSGTAAAAGLLLLFWPEGHSNVSWDPSLHAASVDVHGSF
jgi:hypothetical protein